MAGGCDMNQQWEASTLIDAYELGKVDRLSGLSRRSNPYLPGSQKWFAWDIGWEQEDKVGRKANDPGH